MRDADGILLLYHLYPGGAAQNTLDNVRAFRQHSRHAVWPVNLALGVPPALTDLRFPAIVLHYTLFYSGVFAVPPEVRAYLAAQADRAFVTAFLQDEQDSLDERLAFCRDAGVDLAYSCLEPEHIPTLYGDSGIPALQTHLPGYVSDELVATAGRLNGPIAGRSTDVGYRGRRVPPEWGPEAREKEDIAVGFSELARGAGLTLDIEIDEDKRLYGRRWYRFLANCRWVLGTESGGVIRRPGGVTIPYRTVGPRHLEAAAFGCGQVLFEGTYSGLLEPWRDHLPLRKDFGNLDEVLAIVRDPAEAQAFAGRAHERLIASGELSYRRFIAAFEDRLASAGAAPARRDPAREAEVARVLHGGLVRRRLNKAIKTARFAPFPGRRTLKRLTGGGQAPARSSS